MSTSSSTPFIEFRQVRQAFGKNRLYDDLSLCVNRGETMTILGGSGSGKSVMLKLLIGLLKRDAGVIRFDGQDLVPLAEPKLLPVRRRISMLFQGGALFDSLSVGDNVAYLIHEHLHLSAKQVAERVAEKLALVGLPGIENMWPAELSGGMRKRVAIARAIAADPEVLLYDEPTTGLDPINTRRINELIMSIQRNLRVTSLVVTHDMATAFMISDRMAMLSERRILATLTREEFRGSQESAIHDFGPPCRSTTHGPPKDKDRRHDPKRELSDRPSRCVCRAQHHDAGGRAGAPGAIAEPVFREGAALCFF